MWWLLLSSGSSSRQQNFGSCWRLYGLLLVGMICSLLVQPSESSFVTPTPTTTTTRTRHHNVGWYRSSCSSSSLSANKQQSSSITIEEEKPKLRRTWEESFELLVSYKERYGNCNVPQTYKEDLRLGIWVNNQRKTKDKLSDERIVKLDDLGFSWSKKQRAWEESYQLLVSYKEKYGNCNVPQKYKNDSRLGYWVNSQRERKEKLSDERIAKLDDLGFSWSKEIFEDQWDDMFQKLVQYAKENNGDCNIPRNDDGKVNSPLYKWVTEQRSRKSLLSMERQSKLDKLGLIWEGVDKVKADQKWNVMYEHLQEYKRKNGHCRVPMLWEDNPALGMWVSRQRILYRKERLPEDRQMKLEEMDFTWRVRNGNAPDYVNLDFQWFVKFGMLLNFLEEHGHCDVPYKKDNSLGLWVVTQRQNQMKGDLRDDRKERLDDIGFTWNFDDQKDEKWNEKYKELKSFKEQNGHLRLAEGSLVRWACQQRIMFANGKMDPKRKALLDDLDFRLEIETRSLT